MGAQRGSRRVALTPELIRSCGVRVFLREGQYADLRTIAEGWGVPPATAAYAMVVTFLAECRRNPVDLGPVGVKIAASSLMLTAQGLDAHAARLRER